MDHMEFKIYCEKQVKIHKNEMLACLLKLFEIFAKLHLI